MDVVREHSMTLDMEGFDKCMLEQKNRARQLTKFKDMDLDLDGLIETKFIGYDHNAVQVKSVSRVNRIGQAYKIVTTLLSRWRLLQGGGAAALSA